MVKQFESRSPMIDTTEKAIFFANEKSDIPQGFQNDYDLQEARLGDWSNMEQIVGALEHQKWTWGVNVPVLPGEGKRVSGAGFLKIMQDSSPQQ